MSTPAVDDRTEGYWPFLYWYSYDGGITWPTSGSTVVRQSVDIRQRPRSVKNPLRGDWTRAPSAWSHHWHRARAPKGVSIADDPWGTTYKREGNFRACEVTLPSGLPDYSDGLEPLAWNRVLLKAKAQQVDLGVALAEAGKTGALLAKTASEVRKGITNLQRSLRPSGMKQLAKELKAIARDPRRRIRAEMEVVNRYLEVCYGWTPLYNDVLGSMEACYEVRRRGHLYKFTVASGAEEEIPFSTLDPQNEPVGFVFTGSSTQRCRIALCYETPAPGADVGTMLGLTNPLSVAYELIPYSFVVDWALPIGDWLRSLDALVGKKFIEGSMSRYLRYQAGVTFGRGVDYPQYRIRSLKTTSEGYLEWGQFDRKVLSSTPLIPPPPSLKNPLNLQHVARESALLAQALERWHRGLGFFPGDLRV